MPVVASARRKESPWVTTMWAWCSSRSTVVTLPYGALVGVLLYLDLRARKERLDLDTLRADLQASAA